jgi:hypothetical protein
MASQRQWKKEGWGQKTPRTGYFREENWEGGRPPCNPIYIYIISIIKVNHTLYAQKEIPSWGSKVHIQLRCCLSVGIAPD